MKIFKNKVFVTKSFEETQELGKKVANELKGGEVLALYGDLGSGKTTFVQGLAKGLGIKRRIISPTFIIVRRYELGIKCLYHVDLYRVSSENEIKDLGLEEILENKNAIVAIEWAEKLKKLLPQRRINIEFSYIGDARKIKIHEI